MAYEHLSKHGRARHGCLLLEPQTRQEIQSVAEAVASVERGLRWTAEQDAALKALIREFATKERR